MSKLFYHLKIGFLYGFATLYTYDVNTLGAAKEMVEQLQLHRRSRRHGGLHCS